MVNIPFFPKKSDEFYMGSDKQGDDRYLLALGEAFIKDKETKTSGKVTKNKKLTKRIPKEKLHLAYRLDEVTFRCVNFYATQVVGPGFYLLGDSKAQEVCWEFTNKSNLLIKLEDVVRDMCIGGNGWFENIFNGKDQLIDIAYVDFRLMDFKRDSSGNVEEDDEGNVKEYEFESWSGDKKVISQKKIVHFPLFGWGNELAYGFVEPLYRVIYDKLNARHGFSQAGWRAGFPLYVVYVGDKPEAGYPGHKPNQDIVDKISNEFENVQVKHKFVMPYWTKVDQLNPPEIELTPLLEYFDVRITGGFGVPIDIALGGSGKSNKATLEISVTRDLDRRIDSIQNKLAFKLQNEIFPYVCTQNGISVDKTPRVMWKETTPMDLNRAAKRRFEYIQIGILKPEDLREIVMKEEGLRYDEKSEETQGMEELRRKIIDTPSGEDENSET